MIEKKARTSKYLKIGCPRCSFVQIVFGNSTTIVKCRKCNYMLLKTRGGKAKIRAPVKEVIWN